MLAGYFDESFSEQYSAWFVCGWLASVARWEAFEVDWKLVLAKYDVPYLHLNEYAHSIEAFAKWKGKQWDGTRKRFMADLADVICATVEQGFVCYVREPIFWSINARYRLQDYFHSAYAFLGRMCVELAMNWRNKAYQSAPDIKFVFEDGGPDKGGLVYAMENVRPFMSIPSFEPSRDVKPSVKHPQGKKGMVQLQASDYLAYEVCKLFRDMTRKLEPRKSFMLLPISWQNVKNFHSRRLEFLCKKWKIPKR
jgi:hypothetical protein